uniref:DNA-directed RNA polymerase subunit beta'' n=1 Tax=Rhodomonas salina TaxID=3034 RepID=RPOC2_RHOSW|nr:RNA polymerase beta'' subunit [Rhodomonas salina]A6MVX2.1 RecName: Full=DNA-directed RNA polymerase subunit beta''; AltName: Full=PEP; AltName: Full=Plastid-encoded RNA polymerase subunit beta''; Short=RNA polymerase subunit beta'' [Rhodomonas salina]ABO70813.1 RNA polymerase beta' chain [Rhodomonas salina]
MKEKYLFIPPKPKFTNKTIDKKELKKLMAWAFSNYGTGRASYLADKIKDLGFQYATKAGLSLSVEDLRVPPTKRELLKRTNEEINLTQQKYERGEITTVERFQKVIDTWNNASEELKDEVVKYFKETDPLNTIYIMAFSGARGNISQVRQLVGMRGLMADPQGQIIDLPIKSNFREGLTVTDYIISSYGARKGLVDTALRTADSGYLTRRLVDVAQDIIIREIDCDTDRGILLKDMVSNNQILIPLQNRLLGRVLFETLHSPDSANVIAHINQDLDHNTAEFIVKSGIKSVIVRSPLTCESSRSVCQFCYGWNLAHGSLVDLGEAVGIIAAQSIGEPGTQLTMRTFHTGGVFTGELAEQIRAPFDGVLRIPKSFRTRLIRTRHGEEAFVLEDSYKLDLYDSSYKKHKIEFKQGTILFLNDNEQFKKSQVIGELSTKSSMITERVTKDLNTENSGEVCFSNLYIEEKIDRQGNSITNTPKGGCLWILSGEVYNLPSYADIKIKEKQFVEEDEVLATSKVISDYGGLVRLNQSNQTSNITELQIVTSSVSLDNATIVTDDQKSTNSDPSYTLEMECGIKFHMLCSPGNKIVNSQIIAELIDTKYQTSTGGIVKYDGFEVNKKNKNKKGYEILGEGALLWIPEETHEINKDISLLLVEEGQCITAGTQIVKELYSLTEGYIQIIQENEIVKEVIVKPGKEHVRSTTSNNLNEYPKIVKPNDPDYAEYNAQGTIYIEELHYKKGNALLIRPVIEFRIDNEKIDLKTNYLTNENHHITIKPTKRVLFKDGQRVKSKYGVDLLKTYLIMSVDFDKPHLSADVEFVPAHEDDIYKLHLTVLETLQIKQDDFGESKKKSTITSLCVKQNELIKAGSTVAETHLLAHSAGFVQSINQTSQSTCKVLILTNSDEKSIDIYNQTPQVSQGDFIRSGDQIANGIIAETSGQIVEIETNKIKIRSGTPYLVSSNAILQVKNGNLVETGDTLAILVFERSKTGDIVQGLPRIEEILEARKPKEPSKLSQRPGKITLNYDSEDNKCIRILSSNGEYNEYIMSGIQKIIVSNGENILLAEPITDGAPNPHEMLGLFFNFYKERMPLYEAAKLALQKVQIYLVNEVQNVYQSQNVDISDKHIEVIVRQMTSKVKVEDGGDTTLLPGELVELQQIENINEAMTLTKGLPARYSPVLLGITKSSLNTDSFISAASFQETTRVLTEAAIEGKADWLRGLKENVIIGRLIPAGTGFNSYNDISKSFVLEKKNQMPDSYEQNQNEEQNIEDIILDDNIARNYALIENPINNFDTIEQNINQSKDI